MAITALEIKFLKSLGFKHKDGFSDLLEKSYTDTIITVNTLHKKINYLDIKDNKNGFKIGRDTSADLTKEENYSVLECIDRLLVIGYKPEDITIEKPFSSGSAGKDIYLDILVSYPKDYNIKEKQSKTYMMIEVKSLSEYSSTIKESTKEKKNGEPKSQLLSYLQQDKNAEYIMYYTSYNKGKVIRKYDFIDVDEQGLQNTNNLKELYQHWNKVYHTNKGIFENQKTYKNEIVPLKNCDLEDLSNENSKKIFHQFLTILRKNAISDKSNAFNKIFNLFICKIIDEDNNNDLQFQYKANDDDKTLLNRLTELYKIGMQEYLKINIDDEYSNNEFSFIDVFNKETFKENMKVVKELVLLLQSYRLKYNHKQQFLGDFFENLLNTGLKQENGQFFTPKPIAKFIIKSLPIERIIKDKIKDKNIKKTKRNDTAILPYSIDYAAGSGHFLTELMEEYNDVLNVVKNSEEFKMYEKIVQKTINKYTNNEDLYSWADEYIYGLEKDYRLAKTAKISCFLNGDGIANMLYGDGLDNFNSNYYIDKLKSDTKTNENFDVVVANPPYSVSGFKDFLKNGMENFELFDKLGENSDDIECLFIERTTQLLKEGGVAGIILPTSILTNEGVFSHMRTMLLKDFKLKCIVDMSSKGKIFAKTGTNAIILFLEKRQSSQFIDIYKKVKEVFINKNNVTINGIESLVEKYAKDIYELSFDKYVKEIIELLNEENIEIEMEKISFYALNHDEKCLVVNFPQDVKLLKSFIGYSFSERNSNEGLQEIKDEHGNYLSNLYSEVDKLDEEKLNYYIYKHMNNCEIKTDEIHEELKQYIKMLPLNLLLDYDKKNWVKSIKTSKLNKKIYKGAKCQYKTFSAVFNIKGGNTFSKEYQGNKNKIDIPYFKVSDMNNNETYMVESENYVTKDVATKKIKANIFSKGTTIFPKVGMSIHTNKKRILEKDSCVDNNIYALTPKQDNPIYLFNLIKGYLYLPDIASKSSPPSMNDKIFNEITLPIPDITIQNIVASEIQSKEKQSNLKKVEKEKKFNEVNIILEEIYNKGVQTSLGSIFNNSFIGATPSKDKNYYTKGKNIWINISDMKNKILLDSKNKVTDLCINETSLKNKKSLKGSLLLSFKLSIGKVGIAGCDLYTNEAIMSFNKNDTVNQFVYYLLKYKDFESEINNNIKSFGNSLNSENVLLIEVPYINNIIEQEEYIKKLDKLHDEILEIEKEIKELNDHSSIFDKYLK